MMERRSNLRSIVRTVADPTASAAMAFDIHMSFDGQPMLIRVIDVMTFDESGKIIDMKAYHGPSDMTVGETA